MSPFESRRGEIRTEVRAGVGWITLSRPDKRNALTTSMWGAIPGVVAGLVARGDLVGIALQGAEGTFGAGADLDDIARATEGPAEAQEYATLVVSALLAVANAPLPVLAFVAGVAAGGAAELALACDLRVADEGASFAFPFARMGIVPDRFTLDRLVATVGAPRARRLVFTGDTIDAPSALAMGLVDEVTARGELAAAGARWTETLQQGSRVARAGMKRALAGSEAAYDAVSLMEPMAASMLGGEVRAAALKFLASRPRP